MLLRGSRIYSDGCNYVSKMCYNGLTSYHRVNTGVCPKNAPALQVLYFFVSFDHMEFYTVSTLFH